MVRYLLGMQYGLSATLIKAVEDFLEGPGVLHDGGAAAMKEIREIRETREHQVSREHQGARCVRSLPSHPWRQSRR